MFILCNNSDYFEKIVSTRHYSMTQSRRQIDARKFTPNWCQIDTQLLTSNRRKIDSKLGQSCHIISSHNRLVKDEQGRAIGGEGQKKR